MPSCEFPVKTFSSILGVCEWIPKPQFIFDSSPRLHYPLGLDKFLVSKSKLLSPLIPI